MTVRRGRSSRTLTFDRKGRTFVDDQPDQRDRTVIAVCTVTA